MKTLIKWFFTILTACLGVFIFILPILLAYNGIKVTDETIGMCFVMGLITGIAFPIITYDRLANWELVSQYYKESVDDMPECQYQQLSFPVFRYHWMYELLPVPLYTVNILQYLDPGNKADKILIKKIHMELIPALEHLNYVVTYNKQTQKMHKDIIPQIKDLHKKFKLISDDLSACDIDTKELIVQNLTDNIDDVIVYIQGIQKPFDEVIRYESDVKQAMKKLKKQNVDYFSDLRSYNSLSGSDIDELAKQYENMNVKKLKKINKKTAKKSSTKDESLRTSS